MAAECLATITEQWIRERLNLTHPCLGDVRSLSLPGTREVKIQRVGNALRNFVRLRALDLSCNALISVEGLLHLKTLERLNLYYNCIPSIEEIKKLSHLPVLRELDLRLNPLTKSEPDYRLHLVNAMSGLRKLDDCPVRDTERKVAVMQCLSEHTPKKERRSVNQAPNHRSSDLRVASVKRLTQKLGILDDTDDIVLNFAQRKSDRGLTHPQSPHKYREPMGYDLQQEAEEGRLKTLSEPGRFSPVQEMAKSILRQSPKKYTGHKESKTPQNQSSSTPNVADKPRVSFNPYVEKHHPSSATQKNKGPSKQIRLSAKGHFTANPEQSHHCSSPLINIRPPSPRCTGLNLSNPSNPILHPPRASYSCSDKTAGSSYQPVKADQQKKGSYRKPLGMLLDLVDKHWAGERSLHLNNNFLSQAVKILSMMENDVSTREAEVRTLRGEVNALKHQADIQEEKHTFEVHNVCSQLEEAHNTVGKLNEQLRIVLEENVSLQKQLIKLEQQYLKSLMKMSPISQIKEAQTEVEELRKEIEVLREKVHEAEKVKDVANVLQESRW